MFLVYIPCPSTEVAEKIARTLLQEKLIGCANLIPGMKSLYWWEEKIEASSECILLLKTMESPDAKEKIFKRVTELHPYDVPCIMSFTPDQVNASYLSWLQSCLK